MQGNLKDMTIVDLIQHNCQDRKTARLVVEQNGLRAILYFAQGEVVHAVMNDLKGEEVVFRILDWEDGQFNLETGIQPPAVTITRSWAGLLLAGAQRLDEQRSTAEPVRSDTNQDMEGEEMAQKLDDVLKEISTEVAGFVAAAVVGMDGLGIAQYSQSGKLNIENANAQTTMLVKLVDSSLSKLDAGVLEDNLLTTESSYLLIRFMKGTNHFLGIAADRKSANLGTMRLISRVYADRLGKMIPH